ncbi:2-polyprenyl-6-methoxyphenol hydroxylase-like FAD-dependent oxidoreductase [Paraburkholderia sp. BL23I1N1]|uniref:flavin-dependent oxidoreductase n=1 Tax=Paraburkholderia sp. BL23I1N1 TaxID=1938802 RepID=UPI000E70B353|nr:flavin-dependent oxidoreductase [Paraburkholderia sp. BL23I1N1]RKE38671.1 2-polyprenyl-6-methoxyphenol hydroxylase-like FAD-dependent oxidoreductase [Paraburkholderia sp. BL23I1N1]
MKVVIVGAGIGGLTLALFLHKAKISCEVFEAAPAIRPLGAGLNLLPHATTAFSELELLDRLLERGVETSEVHFYTHHGQFVDGEPRGRFAGYDVPQISIHRADLHEVLLSAARERLGDEAVRLGRVCRSVEQDPERVRVNFADPSGAALPSEEGSVVIACDGIHSVVRKQFHPDDSAPIDHGTTCFRGVTRWKPFLDGATMAYVGTYDTGKLVVYPIRNSIDAEGKQLINWVIEVKKPNDGVRDWNRQVSIEACIEPFVDWRFEWLDIASMLRATDEVLQYPMVDRNPLPFWTRGRVTLLGDAAHPMLPRGSNGAAQAILDARLLAELLATKEPLIALKEYEATRLPATADIVLTNRNRSPDEILRIVEERTGGQPFEQISDVISRGELDEWQSRYKRVAGFERERLPQ